MFILSEIFAGRDQTSRFEGNVANCCWVRGMKMMMVVIAASVAMVHIASMTSPHVGWVAMIVMMPMWPYSRWNSIEPQQTVNNELARKHL